MAEQTLTFETEVSRLLDLVINSLYSQKQIFLRELISNASDACDKLRYEAITRPELTADDPEFRIRIVPDAKAGTLSVADNGVGMNRDGLISELGTIARSGTAAFLDRLAAEKTDEKAGSDLALIGQFGVGFYSAFMVADRVEVVSRRAGEAEGWRWSSDGKGQYTVAEAERAGRGTAVTLHLKKDSKGFLDPAEIKRIVRAYSDHIAIPIVLEEGGTSETVNTASALWTRPRSGIKEEEYKEFYHHAGHAFDEPWLTLHFKAEGKIEYTSLLFVPAEKPFDLFDPVRRHRVKLYVKRVFITDECEGLVPPWLRFLRGIVDSEDLPLNVSREMLQSNPVVARIRQAVVRRVLSELQKKADRAPEEYAKFWANFGAVLKEGIYEDAEHRDQLLKLARFRTTATNGLASLDEAIERMRPGQEAIYTIAGDEIETLKKSPQLEGFAARGIEVLLLTDPVDEFWTAAVPGYREKPFRSATRAGAELAKVALLETEGAPPPAAADANTDALVALLKLTLKDEVKDVRASERLTESAVCLVSDAGDPDIHLERLLKLHGRDMPRAKRILEINPGHALIRALAARVGAQGAEGRALDDAAWLLLDQARILEGEALPDATAFARRMAAAMEKGLG